VPAQLPYPSLKAKASRWLSVDTHMGSAPILDSNHSLGFDCQSNERPLINLLGPQRPANSLKIHSHQALVFFGNVLIAGLVHLRSVAFFFDNLDLVFRKDLVGSIHGVRTEPITRQSHPPVGMVFDCIQGPNSICKDWNQVEPSVVGHISRWRHDCL